MQQVGRNDKCPCGSGKKYKKCHMSKDNKQIGVAEISVLRKMSNKGLPHPLAVRLIFSIGEIKRFALTDQNTIKNFDKFHQQLVESIWEAGYCKDQVKNIIDSHSKNIESGAVARLVNDHQLNIDEDIDVDVRVAFKGVFIYGSIALSYLGKIAKELGYDINFLYGNDKEFEEGIAKFIADNNASLFHFIAGHIREARNNWSNSFLKTRIEMTHQGWQMPEIKYTLKDGKPAVIFPNFAEKVPLSEGVDILYTRLFDFCEDVIVILLATKLPASFAVMHIPEGQRDPAHPVRYKVVPNFQ